jgi:hypothetical protein
MSSGGVYVSEAVSQHASYGEERESVGDFTLEEIRASLKNLRYGSVTIIVQDGVIIQIDRTEKKRLSQPRRTSHRGQ